MLTNTKMNNLVDKKKLYLYCPHCTASLKLQSTDNQLIKKCSKCNFIFWNNPKPVISILLQVNNKILMLQRAHNPFEDYWVLPGGFIRYEETAEEAVKRETREETGLDIKINGIIGAYRIDNDPRGVHIDIIFHGETNGEVVLNEENKNWQYFTLNQLPEKIAYKHRNAIDDWNKKKGQYGTVE